MANSLRTTSLVLTIIGGLNWGLVGLFDFDLVAFLFGPLSMLSRIVYEPAEIYAAAVRKALVKVLFSSHSHNYDIPFLLRKFVPRGSAEAQTTGLKISEFFKL